MELLWENVGWIMLLLTTVAVMWFKYYTKDKDAITSKYRESREYCLSFPVLLEAVFSAMERSGFKNVSVSQRNGALLGQTGFSMSSFLEFIEIHCEQTENGVNLKFLSICGLPTQIYAWGKNKRNANKFFKELDNQLKSHQS